MRRRAQAILDEFGDANSFADKISALANYQRVDGGWYQRIPDDAENILEDIHRRLFKQQKLELPEPAGNNAFERERERIALDALLRRIEHPDFFDRDRKSVV